MCGLCGFTGDTAEDRKKVIEEMMGTLIHRGPDEGRNFLTKEIALGFRRLSIIDREGSSQPMAGDGDKVLVFNGEIYNYRQLRAQLCQAGHRFATQGDSEVLLHGYEEWGDALPEHLRGMFAFAIWDGQKKELYAARDFFGIKPFYYTHARGRLIFASEIKTMLVHPDCPKVLNEEALEQYLSFQYSPLEETFFCGIYRLLPGHWLKYAPETDALTLHCYFKPELAPEKGKGKKTGTAERRDWIKRLEKVIEDSVMHHMIADTEVGTFLSGGVDSGLIASLFTGKKAYTVGFQSVSSKYNEIPLAKRLADSLHLKHTGKEISQREFWDAVPEVLYYLDEPSGDPSAVSLYFVSREAARDVRVVVSGEGADELFGGYRIYCEPNALRSYQKLPQALRKFLGDAAAKMPDHKGRSFLIRGSMPLEERFIGNANLFTQEERRKLLKHPTKAQSPQSLLSPDYQRTASLDDASRMQYVDLLHWLPGDILQKADRMSMAHSLELRVPYLDREVYETARKLPADCKQDGQRSKALFREMARRHLTKAESGRKKLGFPVPLSDFFSSEEGESRLKRAFSSETAEKFFQTEELQKLLSRKDRGKSLVNRKIWAIYAFLVWYEIYFGA